jgi:ribosome modulation factor
MNTESEAFNTGYEAYRQGEPRNANPYCAGTYDSQEWFAGWDEAAA